MSRRFLCVLSTIAVSLLGMGQLQAEDLSSTGLPTPSNASDFCAAVVKTFPPNKSNQAVLVELNKMIGSLAKRVRSDGSVKELSARKISPEAMKGLMAIRQAILSGRVNLSELAPSAFSDLLKMNENVIASLRARKQEIIAQHYASGSLEGAGTIPAELNKINQDIAEAEALKQRISSMTPEEGAALFLAGLGVSRAVTQAVDEAQEAEAIQNQKREELKIRYQAVVRDMVNYLHKKWSKGKWSKETTEGIDRIRGELKTNPNMTFSTADRVLLNDLYQDQIMFSYWGLNHSETMGLGRMALAIFLTTDGPMQLDESGKPIEFNSTQAALLKRVIKPATDVDFAQLDQLSLNSRQAEKDKFKMLASALRSNTSGKAMILEPNHNSQVLENRYEIAEALLAYYEAASRYSQSKDEGVSNLAEWLTAGTDISRQQLASLKSTLTQSIPVAERILKRRSSARFWKGTFKWAAVLSLLTAGASTASHGLDYAGIYQEALSWEEQAHLAKKHGNEIIDWSELKADELMKWGSDLYDSAW